MSTNSSSHSPAIHLGAFLRTLIAPLMVWGAAVAAITASGQPGVVCVTPLAWLMALWCGGQYIRLSDNQPGRRPLLGASLVGAALGLGMGVVFILVSTQTMPVAPDEVSKMQLLTAFIVVVGSVVCAALSTFTAQATLRRYARGR
jgi:hypothetical protein